jgi:regulator of sirC expression with transglutaminase-like and TPR domain
VVEHYLDTVGVTGSNPVSRTISFQFIHLSDLSSQTHAVPPAPQELEALLRLLDDDTPSVRERVAERLGLCGGDISEWLSTHTRPLSRTEERVLEQLLSPARRANLMRDWQVPSRGAAALRDDWDYLEATLRLISDFLHDGIHLRQPLSDALDLLAEEASEKGVESALQLRSFMFSEHRIGGNEGDELNPLNNDLAWAITHGKTNPPGACAVFALVAKRLDFDVELVDFPNHMLCRIFEDGYPLIVDCYDKGALHFQDTLLETPELDRSDRRILRDAVGPDTLLIRLLDTLAGDLDEASRPEDADLVRQLRATLD